jgi:hypothetical protein
VGAAPPTGTKGGADGFPEGGIQTVPVMLLCDLNFMAYHTHYHIHTSHCDRTSPKTHTSNKVRRYADFIHCILYILLYFLFCSLYTLL